MRCICPLRSCPARGDRIPVERLVYSRISAQPLRIVSSPIVTIPCLKELKPASCSCCRGPSEQTSDSFLALRFVSLFADVIPTQADGRDFLSSPPQSALGHSLLSLGHQSVWTCGAENRSRRGRFQERASAHHGVDLFGRSRSACFVNYRAHKRSPVGRSEGQTERGVHCWRL